MNSQVGLKRPNYPQLVNKVTGCPPMKSGALQEHEAAATKRVAKRREDEASSPRKMFLPGMDAFMRAMPNPVALSSLFAPIARGKKHYHYQVVLVSRGDATMTYTGQQLNEPQADVWMQLVYEAKNSALGDAVTICRAAFLRAIGRGTSGREYSWLHQTMLAFTSAMISIEVRRPNGELKYSIGHTNAFHMLADFEYNPDTEKYSFTIDARWKKAFDGREYSLVDLEKRLKIGRGQDMAKALQRLVATSSDSVQRYGLDWLKGKLQYSGTMYDFKDALKCAMREMERVEIIAGGRIGRSTRGKDQVVWTKLKPSA